MTTDLTAARDRFPSPQGGRGSALTDEAPRLAPGVELVGEQPHGGFQERQWLAERDGRFLQISELLYRTLEQLNGQRGLDSIATRLSEVTDWAVTANDVRQLLDKQLIPAGLAVASDRADSAGATGAPASAQAQRARSRPRSPLAVKARFTIADTFTLEPITRALRFLYAAPVTAIALAGILAAYLWLYLRHGMTGAMREVMFQPALLIPVIITFVLSAAFHELGHATALHYSGGRARGIGGGVYLVYPVFFTDTTEAYRLGRGARVRVDLGGFYFQLLAGAGLIAVAAASGQGWMMLTAFAINVEAVRQLLFPFVRLDGYWLFADLTGIPDFFSHVRPFVRGLLPRSLRKGPTLPPLRRATRAIFIGYLTVGVPLLGFLLFQLATRTPGVTRVAWESFKIQETGLRYSLAHGDVAGALGSVAKIGLLAMPTVGTLVLSLVISTWTASVLWRRRRLGTPKQVKPG
jgi:putative peptide zinc metalloprotease protein